jgi:hypothetical protein
MDLSFSSTAGEKGCRMCGANSKIYSEFAPERNYRRGKGLFDCTYFQN